MSTPLPLARAAREPLPAGAPAPAGPGALLVPLGALVVLLLVYAGTFASMVTIWARSSTFAHGALIFPLAAWLVWRQRGALASVARRPCHPALALLAVLGLLWLMARLAQVQVAAQFALVGMIPAALAAMLGLRLVRAIAFPLAYLLLAVPSGEVLIAPLIDFTAAFTVGALQLTGVPVLREGSFLILPTGTWAVEDACSGLRYLIASFALGTLYAYHTYRSLRRRLLFVAASVLLPILANGVRAYVIVMLGHWTDMRLAAGIDHVIYGWVFFCFLLLLLFWLGSFWREAPASASPPAAPATPAPVPLAAALACVALALAWPLLLAAWSLHPAPLAAAPRQLAIDAAPGLDSGPAPALLRHVNPDAHYLASFRHGARAITLQVALYRRQRPGAELIAAGGAPFDATWRRLDDRRRQVALGGGALAVLQSVLEKDGAKLLVWRWYRQSGVETNSALRVKLLLAVHKLLRQREDGTEIVVATGYEDNPEQAAAALTGFLTLMRPSILRGVDHDGVN
ncbi:MAG: exosortase A [Telluria sp.]|nr:exosortase A [Telluria sp.]